MKILAVPLECADVRHRRVGPLVGPHLLLAHTPEDEPGVVGVPVLLEQVDEGGVRHRVGVDPSLAHPVQQVDSRRIDQNRLVPHLVRPTAATVSPRLLVHRCIMQNARARGW